MKKLFFILSAVAVIAVSACSTNKKMERMLVGKTLVIHSPDTSEHYAPYTFTKDDFKKEKNK